MYGIVLIVVLIITGGAIAFIGDRLGTKIGKKKLSIFGLRPRHTSIVITIITGILITTLTFIVMAAASENVRLALFGMEKLNAQMKETTIALSQASSELIAANAAKDQATADFQKAKSEVDKLLQQQEELSALNQRLEASKVQLEASNQQLAGQNAALQTDNQNLSVENSSLNTENQTLETSNRKLTGVNSQLEEKNKALNDGLQMVREGDIVYRAGEVIASGVVNKAKDRQSLNAELSGMVYMANRNVSERTGINSEENGVWIFQKEYEQALDTLEKAPGNTVVRVVAAGNLVRGEPVRTHLELYPHRTVYQKDDFVFSEHFTVSGREKGEAEGMMLSFLKGVNSEAVKKGVLPDPLKGSVGVIGGTQFYQVVNSLASIRGNIVLSAYAAQDTDTLGPLRLLVKVQQLAE